MDTIFITALEVDTVIGVYDWEREIRQLLLIDLELGWNIAPAAHTDDLKLTLDYAAVSGRILEFAHTRRFQLVETFAEQLAALLLKEFPIPRLRLRVSKPGAVSTCAAVGVEIQRCNP